MNRHGIKRAWALSALSLALAACSGGSSTINEDPTDTSTITKCGSSNCVDIEFTDDPVTNLNYRCGTVVNLTDNTGVAKCPDQSIVTFYLRAPKNSTKEVVLGSFKVEAVRSITGEEAASGAAPLIRITPKDLVASAGNDFDDLTDTQAAAAVNITRLLQLLRKPEEPYIDGSPVNRIQITDEIKTSIEKLTADVAAAKFNSDTVFDNELKPWLDAIGRNPAQDAKKEDAIVRLNKTLTAIQAGVYYGTPTISVPNVSVDKDPNVDGVQIDSTIGSLDVSALKLGIEGSQVNDSAKRATMALYMLTDRSGHSVGQGMYWAGSATTTEAAYKLYTTTSFRPMTLTTGIAGFDKITSKIQQMVWSTPAIDAQAATRIVFDQGKLIRNFAMFGGEKIYRVYTGLKAEDAVPSEVLGTWKQYDVNTNGAVAANASFEGSATLTKAANVNTFLDRDVWRTKDTVAAGQTYVFPLHATLTFKLGAGCPNSTPCTLLDTTGITILESGDIISDHNIDCSAVDGALKDEAGEQEYRIGTVRAAYTSSNGSDYFIGPTILIGNDIKGKTNQTNLNGMHISTIAPAPRVKMNLAGVINAKGAQGTVNMIDSSSDTDTSTSSAPAKWVNVYNLYYALKEEDKRTDVEKDLAKKYAGIVSAATSSCYRTSVK